MTRKNELAIDTFGKNDNKSEWWHKPKERASIVKWWIRDTQTHRLQDQNPHFFFITLYKFWALFKLLFWLHKVFGVRCCPSSLTYLSCHFKTCWHVEVDPKQFFLDGWSTSTFKSKCHSASDVGLFDSNNGPALQCHVDVQGKRVMIEKMIPHSSTKTSSTTKTISMRLRKY